MSGPLLTAPGFWGKLPAAGDFVARRLPAAFVDPWDRWVSRHLAPSLGPGDLLCFATGTMTGVVVASADRAGRHFPLALAAPLTGIAPAAWYAALAALGHAAAAGALDLVTLDARLAALPTPSVDGPAAGLLLWPLGGTPRTTDPEAPEPVIATILAAPSEAG